MGRLRTSGERARGKERLTRAQGLLALVSYRVHVPERHVRAVPAVGLDGSPFRGPGVDLRGDDADRAIAAIAPIVAWLEAREPGIALRSLSVKAEGPRVLVSLEPTVATDRPRVLRFERPWAEELRECGRDAEQIIGEACARALARRLGAGRR